MRENLLKARRLKIAFIAPLLMRYGGANRFLVECAESFSKKGYHVRIYSLIFEPNKTFKVSKQINVIAERGHQSSRRVSQMIDQNIIRRGRILSPPFLIPAMLVELLIALKAYIIDKPRVIFVSGNHTLIGLLTFMLRKCKFVSYYHWLPPTLEWKSSVIRTLRLLEKFTMLKCVAIANSNFTAQAIKRETGFNIKVVHPGVNLHRFKDLRRCDDGRTLINVARISPSKKQIFLIHLMHKLENFKGLKLILCGTVGSKQYLANLHKVIEELGLEDRIIIIDFKDEFLTELLSKSTLYLHPSVESFGISIVEAMSMGIPALVYKQGGQCDIVSHDVNGFLAGDEPEEWVNYIIKLMTNEKLFWRMAEAARRKASELSWDKVVDELEHVVFS